MLAAGAISWKTKPQSIVAMSSTEGEYISLAEATKEAIWMRCLLKEVELRMVKWPGLNPTRYPNDKLLRQLEPNYYFLKESQEPESLLVSSRPQITPADTQGSIKMTKNILGNTRAVMM